MTKPDMSALTGATIVPFLADIIERRGAESYLGEEVTMAGHMLQAARLAEQANAGDELIAAALLHDIGHYTNEFPEDAQDRGIDNVHEEAGASVLEPFFPAVVVDCTRHHVAAKRYLCATDPSYFDRLSPASVHTLNLQGGPISAEEVESFRSLANLDAIIQVRRWDEGSKVKDLPTPDFGHYAPVLQRVVDRHMVA
ncbi:MAG: HD domain-containing protein [Alphaproteobacteria bacterium]|nr:HD domain-containing protein [Alphaproteobacteria bacterium]